MKFIVHESDSVCLNLTADEVAHLMLLVGYASVKAGEMDDQRSIAFAGAVYKASREAAIDPKDALIAELERELEQANSQIEREKHAVNMYKRRAEAAEGAGGEG